MGFLSCPCPPPRNKEKIQRHHSSASNHLLSSDSSHSNSSSLISSQPSLPSLRSLTIPQPPAGAIHHQCIATVKGHSSFVFTLSLAGKHLFSGSHDGEIRVWPNCNGQTLITADNEYSSTVAATTNGAAAVKSLVILGDKLLSAHQDNKVRVWRIEERRNDAIEGERSLRCIATLPTLEDRFLTLFSAKNYVRVRRNKMSTWVHHVDAVSALAVSHDGIHLYSASWDRTVKIWRTSDFKCLESIPNAHDDAINAVAVSYDGRVYTGSADKKIKVWTRESTSKRYSLLETLEKHKSAVNALALTPDGAVLYSGACDRSVVVWEREASGDKTVVVGALRGHSKAILCLAVVGDELLFSGSADKTVRVWRRGVDRTYACLAVLEGHARPVKCLAAAVDGFGSDSGDGESYLVYSGGLDCDIRVWRISVPSL